MATFKEFATALRKLNFRRMPMTGIFSKSGITFATGLNDTLSPVYGVKLDEFEFGTFELSEGSMRELVAKAIPICESSLYSAERSCSSKRTISGLKKQIVALREVKRSFTA